MSGTHWSGIIVKDSNARKIQLVLEHDQKTGKFFWGLAGGQCDRGEDPFATATRELSEEALLKVTDQEEVSCILKNVDIKKGEFCSVYLTEVDNTSEIPGAKSSNDIVAKDYFSLEKIEQLIKEQKLKRKSVLILERIKGKIF